MYITLNCTTLPQSCYEIQQYHRYGNRTFALEIHVDLSHFNSIEQVWDYKILIADSIGPNNWWQQLSKTEPTSYQSVDIV